MDFYHLAFENEDPDVVLRAGPLIAHVQISDPAARGFPKDDAGEPRYRRFFDNLRQLGYRGRISVEAESKDLAGDRHRRQHEGEIRPVRYSSTDSATRRRYTSRACS